MPNNPMPDVKLKPCPFCGGEAVLMGAEYLWYVECLKCGTQSGDSAKRYLSARRWNRRTDGR